MTSASPGEGGVPDGLARGGRLGVWGVRLHSKLEAVTSGVLGLDESASPPFILLILLMTAGFSTL